MEFWHRAPTALKAYIVLSILWALVGTVLNWHLWLLGIFLLGLLLDYLLLRGFRWIWWVLVVTGGLSILLAPIEGNAWYLVVLNVLSLLLLLLPETRRYFFGLKPGKAVT